MKEQWQRWWDGWCLTMQFFSSIPFGKTIPLQEGRVTRSLLLVPLLGLIFGVVIAFLYIFLIKWQISYLFLSLFTLTTLAFLSGGMHLDGWIDMSDAFFSYAKKERRLEIMSDSRVGAFGVISFLFLILWRWFFIYESMLGLEEQLFAVLMLIPCCSRIVMLHLLIKGPMAKQEGLGYFFHLHAPKRITLIWLVYSLLMLLLLFLFNDAWYHWLLLLIPMAYLFGYLLHRGYLKQFGGLTGDLLGASVEGVESGLWFLTWLWTVFVMA
ncbi:adenosylcobinamide-GDP ribazoletransferase [Rubeoparvulum massiliense]|uniref:adenosylcobinamide-GDP ribazoletransferase n=1 Tax=Rubeoparvulum massiliense TaxID=1631346 RepID=UPI00065E6376|nr:adenosylcobinamide-GDP ribazoletransferase [Rubeoparvulum massiliense]